MNMKHFVLTYYKNACDGIHIQKVEHSVEAQRPHTHAYFQIYYIIRGSLVHYTEGDCSCLTRGDMCIIPPEKSHYISKADDVCFYSFSFTAGHIGAATDRNRLAADFLTSLSLRETVYAKTTVPSDELLFVENLMERIYKEFTDKKTGYGELIHSCTVALIAVFARNYVQTMPAVLAIADNRRLLLHCIEYIKQNSSEPITLAEMERYSLMSKSCFCKHFQELTGTSFANYLNTCRIKRSLTYIKKGYKNTAIYGLCGFNAYTTFYRNFKKIMGMSPQEYKRKEESGNVGT